MTKRDVTNCEHDCRPENCRCDRENGDDRVAVTIRMPRSLHNRLATNAKAKAKGVSLQAMILEYIEQADSRQIWDDIITADRERNEA